MQRKPNATTDYKLLYHPYLLFIIQGGFSPARMMKQNSKSIVHFREQISNVTVSSNLTWILASE